MSIIKGILKWVGISIGIIWILMQVLGIILYNMALHAVILNS